MTEPIQLTDQESQVLEHYGRGRTREEMAELMCKSVESIDKWRAGILSKLHLRDTVAIALEGQRRLLLQAIVNLTAASEKSHI